VDVGDDDDGLRARGRALWDDTEKAVAGERGRALLLEACRIADRLDGLALILGGDAADWLEVVEGKADGDALEVRIDAVLAEARQQAGTLRAILTSLPMRESDDAAGGGAWLNEL
jgi:hypothetical protein